MGWLVQGLKNVQKIWRNQVDKELTQDAGSKCPGATGLGSYPSLSTSCWEILAKLLNLFVPRFLTRIIGI